MDPIKDKPVVSYTKDPDAVLDYAFNWEDWLDGDTIATSTWTAPTGITVVTSTNTTTKAIVKLSGGTAGSTYDIVNRIVSSAGFTDERTMRIYAKDR